MGGAGGGAEEGEDEILVELQRKQAELKAVVSCIYHNIIMIILYREEIFAVAKFHGVAIQAFRKNFHGSNVNFATAKLSRTFGTMQKFPAVIWQSSFS